MVAARTRNFTLYLNYTTTDSFDTLSSSLFSAIAVCDGTRSPPLDSVAQPDTMEGLSTPTFIIFSHFCFEREEATEPQYKSHTTGGTGGTRTGATAAQTVLN